MSLTKFRIFDPVRASKKCPLLVFGPDLHTKTLPFEVPTLNDKSLESWNESGTKFHSISTKSLTRNLCPAGTTKMKPIISYIKEAPKRNPAAGVNTDLVTIVCKASEVVAIASQFAQAWPIFSMKTDNKDEERVIELDFFTVDDDNKSDKSCLISLIENIRNAARIVDTPTNFMHTNTFLSEAEKVVSELPNCSLEVIKGEDLEKRGFGGIWSVGMAAVNLPALAILKLENGDDKKKVCLVGKGIVYDTGGLSIKSKTGMVRF